MVKRSFNYVCQFFLSCLLSISIIFAACAIDNPDAPDLIGEFEKREMAYLMAIDDHKNNTRDFLVAYNNYLLFLDKELNKAFTHIKMQLTNARKSDLITAQLAWLKFRDKEFELIKSTWTHSDFGSSAGISRGDYRTRIVKDRVVQLLHYAKNL